MGNGGDRAQQTLPNTFANPSMGWQPSAIWSNNGVGVLSQNRDAGVPRGSFVRDALPRPQAGWVDGFAESTDAFPSGPSGSAVLVATSGPDPWGTRPGPWNPSPDAAAQALALSGNTSPRSRSDASVHDLNNGSSPAYYTAASSTTAQRGPVGSKPPTALEPLNGQFKYSPFSGFADEKDNVGSFGQLKHEPEQRMGKFAVGQRPTQQESPFLDAVGNGHPREAGMPPSSHPSADMHVQANSFGDFAYGVPTTAAVHSQRPSLAGPSVSFQTQNTRNIGRTVVQQADEADLTERLRSLAVNGGPAAAPDSLANLGTYGSGAHNFPFNLASQPWENGQGYQAGFANGTGFEKRGSVVDRSPPAGGAHRAGGELNSPRSFAGTPQQNPEAWSRPASRDPRIGADIDRRGPGQQFLQQPQQQSQQQPQPLLYPPGSYYTPNFQHFSPHLYDLYQNSYANLRGPLPIPGYGMHMGPYPLGAGAMPFRPARDQDPGRGVRSMLLEEFRSSSKSNKRYELKVRSPASSGRQRELQRAAAYSWGLGHLQSHCRVQRRPAWFSVHPAEARDGQQ